jgi:hypothetical protein
MQLVNDTVAGLAGEVPQQRFARSSALARHLVFRGAERPDLPPRRRVGCLKRAAAENKAEAGLADAGVPHQHDLCVHVVNSARYRGPLRPAQEDIEVELIKRQARAGDRKTRE